MRTETIPEAIRALRRTFGRAVRDLREADEGKQRDNAEQRYTNTRDQLIEVQRALGDWERSDEP